MQFIQGEPYFQRIHSINTQFPYLDHQEEAEVIIIGGGVTGAITAYYFSKLGIKVILVEKSRVAHGSTCVTTALLQYELDQNARKLAQRYPLDSVLKSYDLGLMALDELEKFIQEHGNKCSYAKRDTVLYTDKENDAPNLIEEYKVRKKHGLPVELIGEENNPFMFSVKSGVHSIQGGAELDPFLYTHHLLEVGQQQGLKVYENTEVIDIDYLENGVKIQTTYGHHITGKIVIIATGYNISTFTKKKLGEKTITYNIVTKPLNSIEGWPEHILLRDNNTPYHYLRITSDNRIIIGGEDIPFTEQNMTESIAEKKYELLESKLKTMFPFLTNVEIEYRYCGMFATTSNDLGFIGKNPKQEKCWFNLGYGANGILFAILGGVMLTELYQGRTHPDLQLFSLER